MSKSKIGEPCKTNSNCTRNKPCQQNKCVSTIKSKKTSITVLSLHTAAV